MEDYGLTLFNSVSLDYRTDSVRQELNLRVTGRNFQFSVIEVANLLEQRKQILLDNHLIDFSLENLLFMTEYLSDDLTLTQSGLVSNLLDCQEIFYYLRMTGNSGVSDEVISEKLFTVYADCQGDLNQVRGYFEDYPKVRREADATHNQGE